MTHPHDQQWYSDQTDPSAAVTFEPWLGIVAMALSAARTSYTITSQPDTFLSSVDIIKRSPRAENEHVRTLVLVSITLTVFPVAQSHKRAELSADAVSTRVESTGNSSSSSSSISSSSSSSSSSSI